MHVPENYLPSKPPGFSPGKSHGKGPVIPLKPRKEGLEWVLLDDFAYGTGAYRASTLADGETQTLFHRCRGVQLNLQLDVVPGHYHLGAFRQLRCPGYVRGAEVKLRPV